MIKRDLFPGVMTIIGFAVAALFLVFGFYVIFSPQMASVTKEFRMIFGVVVIGYGLFRGVIIYQKSKQRKDYDDETNF
jgi:amino acid permease